MVAVNGGTVTTEGGRNHTASQNLRYQGGQQKWIMQKNL